MAYNQELELRIDNLIIESINIQKKKMFGGIAYMLNGNMCFGIHKNDLIVRTSKEIAEKLLENNFIRPFDITRRPMKGWIMVSPEYLRNDYKLEEMVQIARAFVESLPPK